MLLAFAAILVGLLFLVLSADKFVDGASAAARHFGMSPLLIGIVIIGFGTSAPEMVVSAIAAFQGNPGIALGNAYGSNITNIGLILGLTALLSPIAVNSQVVRKEMPILIAVTALAAFQLYDGELSRNDAIVLLAAFAATMVWTFWQANADGPAAEEESDSAAMSIGKALVYLVAGLIVLMISSRMLVWGAVNIAQSFGVSDLIIGLTIVAVGTSLPEMASSLMAIRKNQHDLALGNIVGSNFFNTLAVVGIAGVISPLAVDASILYRDLATVAALTLGLFVMCLSFGKKATITRAKGAVLLLAYIGYTAYLISTTFVASA